MHILDVDVFILWFWYLLFATNNFTSKSQEIWHKAPQLVHTWFCYVNLFFFFIFTQVSYQGLDTENQRLQKALENSSKKIQHLEAELQDVETENQTIQRNLEELKISSKRLEQLEQEVGKNKKTCIKPVANVTCRKPKVKFRFTFKKLEIYLICPLLLRRGGKTLKTAERCRLFADIALVPNFGLPWFYLAEWGQSDWPKVSSCDILKVNSDNVLFVLWAAVPPFQTISSKSNACFPQVLDFPI